MTEQQIADSEVVKRRGVDLRQIPADRLESFYRALLRADQGGPDQAGREAKLFSDVPYANSLFQQIGAAQRA
jgi:hypothetical protein